DICAFDHAVALHNIPRKTMHQIIYKKDSFTPAVQSLIIKLFGKTSHAAEPLKGTNPSYAISEIIEYAKNNEQTGEDHPEYRLITPVFVTVGSKDYGISAGYGEIHFTIRSWEQNTMEKATESTLEFVKKQCDKYGLKLETEITASFASNKNDHEVVNHIAEASKTLDLEAFEKPKPFPWGEDFGLFTQHVSGAMFGLGAGENTPALHNPDYDFPDEITPTGINMFYQIAKNICEDV
ncbi:MAG: M20/M25/M40 family metallo-hydrolase, partial [Salibacteraceae bacterium]